jgi:hypothetical protein
MMVTSRSTLREAREPCCEPMFSGVFGNALRHLFTAGAGHYRVRARNARSRVTPDNQNSTHTATRYTLTTIAPINNALAAIKVLKLEEKLVY